MVLIRGVNMLCGCVNIITDLLLYIAWNVGGS